MDQPTGKLAPELEKLRREIEAINSEAAVLCDGLSEEELAWRPAPERWSIAENLIHLRATARVFLPSADQAIESARQRGLYGPGPFRPGLMDRIFVWYVEPPPWIKLPAPKPLRPLLEGPAAQALPEFLESQRQMEERLEAANGLDLKKARVVSPLAKWIRMSLLGFFGVFTGHDRRHLYQATQVRLLLDERRLPGKARVGGQEE